MKFPTIKPRATITYPNGKEVTQTHTDFVAANHMTCVWLLENFEAALKAAYVMGAYIGPTCNDPAATWPDDLAELRKTGINED